VFSAAALPVSATNRAQNQNQVFFGMFRPDASARPRWYGNLKRYQIGLDSTGSLITADQTGANAISSASGFFNPCAVSYWTTDSGTYWNFGGNTPGDCSSSSNSSYSDDPDGALVERGGAAEVIRRGNDPSAISPFTVNRTMYTCTSTSSCPASNSTGMVTFNTTNVSQTALGVSSSATQQLVVNYTLGQDVNDENSNNNVTEPRPSIHGDVVHARPQAVNYGGSTGVVVYYGANDGPFRAVKSDTGQELWSFVAPEHLSKLQRLYNNSPIINYPGVTDASAQAKDYFFDGTAGLYQNADNSKVWIYPTMRRGGRMLYAFDVTTPTAPVLKWRVGCPDLTDDTGCTSGFSHIGQTWSFPNVAGIKGYSSGTSPVIIIGGGYDACEDSDTPVPSCDNEKGARVYAIDALTGSLIARFDTDRSVAADVALVDRDFDGLADHAYVADTGGNLYRIDFVDPSTLASRSSGSWTITKIAAVTSNAGRKFLFAPSVLVAQNKAYIALGSGNRERPLATNYPYVQNITNRFYMFVDTFGTSGDSIDLDGSSLADNTSGTTCVTPTSTLRGWRMDLATGTGEQTVSSAVISGGRILFNTHRATEASANQCGANLGVAQGYNVGLLCADKFVVNYAGIGLPISPVQGTVTLPGNKVQTFVLGGSTSSTVNTPFAPGKVTPSITQKRARVYWYTNGDK
jgi:Tfp pilus tip-associated adhesin PilY1